MIKKTFLSHSITNFNQLIKKQILGYKEDAFNYN